MRHATKQYSEAKYSRSEKRWTYNTKRARQASKAFNKAERKAVKISLKNHS